MSELPSATEETAKPSNPIAFSLETILSDNHDAVEHPGTNGVAPSGWDEEIPEHVAVEGFCVECEGELYPVAIRLIYLML